MPFVSNADGAQIWFEDRGAGPAVVFVHEFGGEPASWDAQLAALDPDHRCIRYAARPFNPAIMTEQLEPHRHWTDPRGPPHSRMTSSNEPVPRRHLTKTAFVAPPAIRDLTIILIDDVYASGATAQSTAHAVLEAGGHVDRIVTIARRVNPDNDLTTAIHFNRQRALGPPTWAIGDEKQSA